MSFDAQHLYDLLPAIYRIRDAEQGGPLKALLEVIAQQAEGLEANLAQLYDDQFAETCSPWVLPYIGDLIGITGLPSSSFPTLSPRAEVAHTIGYRRRKGTAAMFEQLAHDVTGWPARAVEFFELLCSTQNLNHLRPANQSFINVRNANRLAYLGSPFERATTVGDTDLTHQVEVRRIARARGRYNIPNVGVFLYRLRAMSLDRSPAVVDASGDRHRWLFSPLGIDLPLFNLPVTEDEVTHLADPINVPDRITRRAMAADLGAYYGRDKSVVLELADPDIRIEPEEIPYELNNKRNIKVCDLTDWINVPKDVIAIDPVLGRIAFPQEPTDQVLVSFQYGFAAPLGGGEYNRPSAFTPRQDALVVNKVSNTYVEDAQAHNVKFTTITDALAQLDPKGGTVEVVNSGRYVEPLRIDATGKVIELRAADGWRPMVLLNAEMEIKGGPADEVIIDGLLFAGGRLRVTGGLGRLTLKHSTLVPGISLLPDGRPKNPSVPSLIVESSNARIEIDHCIVGAIQADVDAEVHITDSIVDATDQTIYAYTGTKDFGGSLRIENSTVIGMVRTSIMRLASNTIFLAAFPAGGDRKKIIAPVLAQRRQEGCVRFSYLSPGARVPSRFHCQPERDSSLIRPRILSLHYSDPEYCQLSPFCTPEIRQGADDESEMGVFHQLFEPQREAHLRVRIDEYLRFGLEAGVFYVT